MSMSEKTPPSETLAKIRADMKRYEEAGGWARNLGFWITATYRFGHWSHGVKSRPARLALLATYKIAATPWQFFRNVCLPARAKIGAGLFLQHPHNISLPPDVVIGENFTLFQDVTIGRGQVPGVPQIGHDVVAFPGAKFLGGVAIGDRVEVGPNAVVSRDVASGCIVCNQPPRIIARETVTRLRAQPRATGPAVVLPRAASSGEVQ